MEELALNPLRRSRNKRHRSLLIEEDEDEAPLISDDDADDQTNCKNAHHRRWRNQSWSKRIFDWLCNEGWKITCSDVFTAMWHVMIRKKEPECRTVRIGQPDGSKKYPPNITRNQKYSIISFLPLVLFEQFKFFLNFYFLAIAITQFVPELRIGELYTYWAPLGFVLLVTISREAYDDLKRFRRDQEANSQKYTKLTSNGSISVRSSDIRVSDVVVVQKDEKVPADMILLRTTEKNGSCFVRTDQLDGETDWKLRVAVTSCQQQLQSDQELFKTDAAVWAEKPHKDIYNFTGKLSCTFPNKESKEEPLSIDNTLWANTVIASGTAVGLVIYTGAETRSVMNTSVPRSKIGLVDHEINRLTKILFGGTFLLSVILTIIKGSSADWYITLSRFILLFSYIIPISLRVNLDMGKLVYTKLIMRDKKIPNTIVRNSTIPEELGRVEYLMTDKTGTLTQNEMVFKKLCVGQQMYSDDSLNELQAVLSQLYPLGATTPQYVKDSMVKMSLQEKIHNSILALAVCHNVTPVSEQQQDPMVSTKVGDDEEETVLFDRTAVQPHSLKYQASSPDEVALVQWAASIGMTLVHRELNRMQIRAPNGHIISYSILQIFPFKSETKRMGIVLQDDNSKEIVFFMKGADSVMANIVRHADWLEEECDVMAREGLRTLVAGRRILTANEYQEFERKFQQAKLSMTDRLTQVNSVIQSLENDLELLCVTGVEDQLQVDVRPTLELLRNAGIKIWMLTGDKLETATSIALSSKLISREQPIYTFKQVSSSREVHSELSTLRKKSNTALIITGQSLEVCLLHAEEELIELACSSPVVVCCRCTPTHKEKVVQLLKQHAKKPTCAVGDGGNDVSMIQAADVGIGLVGKEGNQASLAADFSITQFSHLARLLMWHGRNSYKRSASLSQFVMHRGLIISTMQAIFSYKNNITANSLYPGILMIGYTTVYTMAPVFSLVWDEDVSAQTALTFPELYKDLMKGQSLSYKTFIMWILISVYQGGAIMTIIYLFSHHHVVLITFTALLLTELIMVALTIRTWHWIMLLAEIFSIIVYLVSLYLLNAYFGIDVSLRLLLSNSWKILILMLASCLPVVTLAIYRRKCAPPEYAKLMPPNSKFRNCLCCTDDHEEND